MAEVFQYTTSFETDSLDDLRVDWASYVVRLFTNNHTPLPTDTSPATYTEPTWVGYARQTLGALTAAALVSSVAYTDSGVISFPVTSGSAGQTVYGYCVTDAGGVAVKWASLLATPIIPVDGFPVLLQIRLRLRNP